MSTRLTLAAWVALALAVTAIAYGCRWAFLAAILTAAALWTWHGALDWCDRPAIPPPPEGVRIIHPDGTETACEIAYLGHRNGWHGWEVTTRMHVGDIVTCDTLHGPTVLTAAVDDDVIGVAHEGDGYRMEGRA